MEVLALRRLTTAAFGVLMSLEPAIALVVGVFVLGQLPGWWAVAGIALVVAAGVGAERAGARPVTAEPSQTSDAARRGSTQPGRTKWQV
jgi:inner membrane transporter RhtA